MSVYLQNPAAGANVNPAGAIQAMQHVKTGGGGFLGGLLKVVGAAFTGLLMAPEDKILGAVMGGGGAMLHELAPAELQPALDAVTTYLGNKAAEAAPVKAFTEQAKVGIGLLPDDHLKRALGSTRMYPTVTPGV